MPAPGTCPIEQVMALLSGRWTLYILWRLQEDGPQRFSALSRQVPGISPKVLTERLKMLETAGLVHRDYEPTVPPSVTYSLTPRGSDLRRSLEDIAQISRDWIAGGWHPETGFPGAQT